MFGYTIHTWCPACSPRGQRTRHDHLQQLPSRSEDVLNVLALGSGLVLAATFACGLLRA
jgi:hypothetical protein